MALGTSARSLRVLATNRDEVFNLRAANTNKEGKPSKGEANRKVMGSKPVAGKLFYTAKSTSRREKNLNH